MQKKYKNSVPLPLHLPVSLIQSQNKSARSWGGGGAATWLWGVVVEGPGALRALGAQLSTRPPVSSPTSAPSLAVAGVFGSSVLHYLGVGCPPPSAPHLPNLC